MSMCRVVWSTDSTKAVLLASSLLYVVSHVIFSSICDVKVYGSCGKCVYECVRVCVYWQLPIERYLPQGCVYTFVLRLLL